MAGCRAVEQGRQRPRGADREKREVAELQSRLRGLIAPFEPERTATQVDAVRQELGRKSQQLARLLKTARAAEFVIPADHRLAPAFAAPGSVAASAATTLPGGLSQPLGPSRQGLIDHPHSVGALGCF